MYTAVERSRVRGHIETEREEWHIREVPVHIGQLGKHEMGAKENQWKDRSEREDKERSFRVLNYIYHSFSSDMILKNNKVYQLGTY